MVSPESKLRVLREIREKGKWMNEKALMSEALVSSPANFSGLRLSHVDVCIDYGNSKLVDMGFKPVTARPEDDPGRCEDIWDEEPDFEKFWHEPHEEEEVELQEGPPADVEPEEIPGDFNSEIHGEVSITFNNDSSVSIDEAVDNYINFDAGGGETGPVWKSSWGEVGKHPEITEEIDEPEDDV